MRKQQCTIPFSEIVDLDRVRENYKKLNRRIKWKGINISLDTDKEGLIVVSLKNDLVKQSASILLRQKMVQITYYDLESLELCYYVVLELLREERGKSAFLRLMWKEFRENMEFPRQFLRSSLDSVFKQYIDLIEGKVDGEILALIKENVKLTAESMLEAISDTNNKSVTDTDSSKYKREDFIEFNIELKESCDFHEIFENYKKLRGDPEWERYEMPFLPFDDFGYVQVFFRSSHSLEYSAINFWANRIQIAIHNAIDGLMISRIVVALLQEGGRNIYLETLRKEIEKKEEGLREFRRYCCNLLVSLYLDLIEGKVPLGFSEYIREIVQDSLEEILATVDSLDDDSG